MQSETPKSQIAVDFQISSNGYCCVTFHGPHGPCPSLEMHWEEMLKLAESMEFCALAAKTKADPLAVVK
jgi:hypothetical protein